MELGPRLLEKDHPELLLAPHGEDGLIVLRPDWDEVIDYDWLANAVHVQIDHVNAGLVYDPRLKQVVDSLLVFTHGRQHGQKVAIAQEALNDV